MTHEFDGKKYAAASTHQKEWGARLIAELGLAGTERILDLGCGDGALTAQLAALAPQGQVLGIDASHGMIDIARSHQAANLAFELRDINALDFADAFDIVFSNATLHWIKDHDTLLANVHRALRKGGVARFNFAGDGNCANFFAVAKEAMALPRFAPAFASFDWPWYMPSVAAYEAQVRRVPFSEARVWGENADRYLPDAEAMIKWIDQPSLVPLLEFRRFVIERMLARTRQPDGRCFETFRRINLLARK